MPGKITIGCRLPNGLTLAHPNPDVKVKVTLAGLHTDRPGKIIGAPYVTTEIDADFWETWKTAYKDYAPLKNGAIFEARTEQEAKAKSREFEKTKTGLEALNPDAHGVKKAV